MGRGIIIIAEGGRGIGKMAAIELAMKEMPIIIVNPTKEQIQYEFNHLSDILPMRFAPIPEFPELIKLTDKKGKQLEEPKSKYINRPIKNYRR